MQLFLTILIIYFFGLGSIIMTYLVIRAIGAYVKAARKEQAQEAEKKP